MLSLVDELEQLASGNQKAFIADYACDMIDKLNEEIEDIENLWTQHELCIIVTSGTTCIEFMDYCLWDSECGFDDMEYEENEEFYSVLKKSLIKLLENLHNLHLGLTKERK